MSVLKGLQPERVFHYFEEICEIPHGSRNTKSITDYLVKFADDHGLIYKRDTYDNVVIYKNAAPGYENAPTVILQGHSDMVAEKDNDSDHDFLTEGLKLMVKGDFVKAEKTTLGADDGIAIAYTLAILEDKKLEHPPLEAVITTNEEIGLLGAAAFDTSLLKGTRLINMDSDDEGILVVGCAGGLTAKSHIPVRYMEDTNTRFEIVIDGLTGGHSGIEIDKNRANSNILMGRFLHALANEMDYMLAELEGGQKDNVITKRTRALILADAENESELKEILQRFQKNLRLEFAGSDQHISVKVENMGVHTEPVLHPVSREKVVFYLMNVPFGVQKMSGQIAGLVESSVNLGILKLTNQELKAGSSVRSSVESAKEALAQKIQYLTEFLGGEYCKEGSYPAWAYNENSELSTIMADVYKEMFHKKMEVTVIHAGLECGLFFDKIPELDCVSFGPDIMDIHTTDEKISVSSTKRMWDYLIKVLKCSK